VFAYIAAVMAHPVFTARFKDDLIQPGLRLPLTADAKLFKEAVALGREVIWLHTYGERFVDKDAGRPKGAPRMMEKPPAIPAGGAIPGAPEPLPDEISYDTGKQRLHVGKGYVDNVTQAMWDYEVSGKQVLWHWFSYLAPALRLRQNPGDSTDTMALNRQPDFFLSDVQPELLEDRPEHVYTADPNEVRRDLLRLLGEARAAKIMPWEPRKVRLYQTIFPQMTNWLPEEEAAQLRFEFAQEMQRLAKAA
jgi:hypothetical protein